MRKLRLGLVAVTLLNAQSAQDPVDLLDQARDKLIARLPRAPRYGCVATIDRSYFSRKNPPLIRPSCERLSEDRKAGRNKLQLDKTDRLRLGVVLTQGREIYSWTGPGTFSRSVDEILHSGPMGTGEMGIFLLEIFSNPLVRFRFLSQHENNLEYGFRLPIEASNYDIRASTQWRVSGYDGSFSIDSKSLELKRLTPETGELPPETSICEASTTMDYPSGGGGVLLPSKAESHLLLRDTTEQDSLMTFSDCGVSPEKPPERQPDPLFPVPFDIPFELTLTTPIDTSTAAAGDVVTARLAEPMRGLIPTHGLIPASTIFTGRILRMEHHLDRAGDTWKVSISGVRIDAFF